MSKFIKKREENKILQGLNSEQKAAVLHSGGHLRIIAGAGSGKTRVITRKIAYLVDELGINPASILAVTFTKKAANEMKERVSNILDINSKLIQISTYHSLCNIILRQEIDFFDYSYDFTILDTSDQKSILKRIYRKMKISLNALKLSSVIDFISWNKTNNVYPKQAIKNAQSDTEQIKGKIYLDYSEELKRIKALDFDDLLIFTDKLFSQNEKIRNKWARKFEYIMIDEFQDSSVLQFKIIKALAIDSTITIVGDPDQTIYTWRGANVNLILDFDEEFSNSTTITLTTNYRSTKEILKIANNLIQNNKYRIHKKLITNNPVGKAVKFQHSSNSDSEARWVIGKINKLKNEKVQLKDIAIFYRANYYSRAFEKALSEEGINYIIYGGIRFYERTEIKDIIAFLWVIHNGNETFFTRIANVPNRQIGEVRLQKIISLISKFKNNNDVLKIIASKRKELDLSTKIKKDFNTFIAILYLARLHIRGEQGRAKLPIYKVIKEFLTKLKYYDYIGNDEHDREARLENIKEFIDSMHLWEQKNPHKSLGDYLNSVTVGIDIEQNSSSTNSVFLMSVHNSKGLQFRNVFIVGLSDHIFPSKRALENDLDNRKLEEERRLFYVGITRAKEKLYFSDSRGFYDVNFGAVRVPSRFITEAGIDTSGFITTDIYQTGSISIEDKEIFAGDVVSHANFGEGTVITIEENSINSILVVAFKGNKGVKRIMKNHRSIEKIA